MENTLKKFLYTSVGFASQAKDKMTTLIQDLMKDGKLSEEEGKRIIDDFKKNTDENKTDFDKKMKDVIDNSVKNLKFVKETEVEKLRNRIDILEKLIKQDEEKNKTKTTTTKKKPTKKKTAEKTTEKKAEKIAEKIVDKTIEKSNDKPDDDKK